MRNTFLARIPDGLMRVHGAVVGLVCVVGCSSALKDGKEDGVARETRTCYRASVALGDGNPLSMDFAVVGADGERPRLVLDGREVVGARLSDGAMGFGDATGQLLLESEEGVDGLTGQWVVADGNRKLSFELTRCQRVACPDSGWPPSPPVDLLRPLDGEWTFYLPDGSMAARLSQQNGNVTAEFQGDSGELTARGTISTESVHARGPCAALARHRLRVSGFDLRQALVLDAVYDGEALIQGSLVTASGAAKFHARRHR